VAVPSSPLAHIRAKERAFYLRSATSIDVALSSNDGLRLTLFDVTRAATLLAGWLWGHFQDAAVCTHVSRRVHLTRLMMTAGYHHDSQGCSLRDRLPTRPDTHVHVEEGERARVYTAEDPAPILPTPP
jgi:hypothetical protein